MKKIKWLLFLLLLAGLVVIGGKSAVFTNIQQVLLGSNQAPAEAFETTQLNKMAAIGTNLDSSQRNQTIQLLGAEEIDASHLIDVDGTVINRYLNDGSDANTSVVSSAMIEPLGEGEGLRVEIVTPTNIELISKSTYENAALTAGAKDMVIKIAAIRPVTGEGALAGVYAMLESMGYQLEQTDIEVAEDEIQLIMWIQQEFGLNDELSNRVIREFKLKISEFLAEYASITETDIREIVIKLCGDFDIEYDQSQLDRLVKFGISYAGTKFATQSEALDALNEDNYKPYEGQWVSILPNLRMNWMYDELHQLENPTEYRNATLYHPIIPAMFDFYFETIQNESWFALDTLLGHTYIVEAMSPQFTHQELTALNQLRAYIYYHAAAVEPKRAEMVGGETSVTIVEEWTQKAWDHQQRRVDQPLEYDLMQKIANATGYGVEAFNFIPSVELDGSKIEKFKNLPLIGFEIKGIDGDDKIGALSIVKAIDRESNQVYNLNEYNSDSLEEIPHTVDFNGWYGVSVTNNYQSPFEHSAANTATESVEPEKTAVPDDLLAVIQAGNLNSDTAQSEVELFIAEMEEEVKFQLESYGVDTIYSIPQRSFDKGMGYAITLNAHAKYTLDSYLISLAESLILQGVGGNPTFDIGASSPTEYTYMYQYDLSLPWKDFIATVDSYADVAIKNLAAMRTLDLSDSNQFHPLIKAMYEKIYAQMALSGNVDVDIVSHTFIFERLVPELSIEEHEVLNYIRLFGYYQQKNLEDHFSSEPQAQDPLGNKSHTKESWVNVASNLETIQATEPERYEAIQQISLATGCAYEICPYSYVESEGSNEVYAYSVIPPYIKHFSRMDTYQYNTRTKEILYKAGPQETDPIELYTSRLDFNDLYGIPFDMGHQNTISEKEESATEVVVEPEPVISEVILETVDESHVGTVDWLPLDWHRITPRMRPEIPDVTWLLMSHHANSGRLLIEPIYSSEAVVSGYTDPNSEVKIEWLHGDVGMDLNDYTGNYFVATSNDQGYFELKIDKETNPFSIMSKLTVTNTGPSGGALTGIPIFGYTPTPLEHPSGYLTLERLYKDIGDIEGYAYPNAEVLVAYSDGYAGTASHVTADETGYFFWPGHARSNNLFTTGVSVTHPETGEEILVMPYPWTQEELDSAQW